LRFAGAQGSSLNPFRLLIPFTTLILDSPAPKKLDRRPVHNLPFMHPDQPFSLLCQAGHWHPFSLLRRSEKHSIEGSRNRRVSCARHNNIKSTDINLNCNSASTRTPDMSETQPSKYVASAASISTSMRAGLKNFRTKLRTDAKSILTVDAGQSRKVRDRIYDSKGSVITGK
jgi:hypothetical protein